MKKVLYSIILMAITSGLVACVHEKPVIPKETWPVEEYIIGPEDVLEIQVWKNAEMSKIVTVRPDGKIALPLVGEFEAAGVTPTALRQEIAKRLIKFQADPEVSVIVQQVNSYNVYVLGEVAHPGRYRLKSYITVLQAISLAGGFTPFASRNNIEVFRRGFGDDHWQVIKNLYKDAVSDGDLSKNIFLRPGDTVLVP